RLDPGDHRAHARHHCSEIDLAANSPDPQRIGLLELLRHLCRTDQRLARNAAKVQAVAAHLVPFDERYLRLHHRSDISGDEAARTGPDDYEIPVESRRPGP